MKTLLACLLSSVVAAVVVTIYSGVENGVGVESFGLMFIVLLYALAIALVIGIPFHHFAKRIRKERGVYYSIAGLVAGAAFTIVPLVTSRGSDASLLKLTLILAGAGFLGGWTFFRVTRA